MEAFGPEFDKKCKSRDQVLAKTPAKRRGVFIEIADAPTQKSAQSLCFQKALFDEGYEVLTFTHMTRVEMWCFCMLLLNYIKIKHRIEVRPMFDLVFKKFNQIRLKANLHYKEAFGVSMNDSVKAKHAFVSRRNKKKVQAESRSE